MNWTNWNDFFAMGGYALYVWGSYGVTLVLLLAEIVLLILRKRSVIGRLVRRAPQVTQ
ncbi:MAG TPA: heme exporter protein CcmD [Burkholderiales bacterium]|nr:heme exporter protein CcmD [Burkholderiales bacterium]